MNFTVRLMNLSAMDALNANNPFLQAAGVKRPTLARMYLAAPLADPIKSDRAFFFASYQGTREQTEPKNSLSSSIFVARPDERSLANRRRWPRFDRVYQT